MAKKVKEPEQKPGLMMKYFVLNPHKADAYGEASRNALRAYAVSILSENEDLALDLQRWVRQIEGELGDRADKD